MKVSLNWIQEYTDISMSVDELVKKIGSQLGEIEEVVKLADVYKDIYVVKVVDCIPHPQADKLSLCKIDDGHKINNVSRESDGFIQVVCGAPNVRAGIKAIWIPPGSTVPATFNKEPFVLESKELRGKVSNGMLASPKELALGDSHDGILEVEDSAVEGKLFADQYDLNDTIIDIENKMLTHRPDLFGQLGIAREIAGISGRVFKSPDWYLKVKDLKLIMGSSSLTVKNEIPDLVPRFMVQVVKGVTIKPSPPRIQSYLRRVGLRPINNVVDLTNYFMLLTAQPLHAYDYDKLKAVDESDQATIIVRKPKANEELTTLNGKTIKLNSDDIVISSANQAIGLGGVMGGANTEVDDSTANIVLECANFDMYAIRRTSMAHGLFSDAVTRFNKGQSPLQNDRILAELISELLESSGGVVEAPIDVQATLPKLSELSVSSDFINTRLGLNLSADVMANMLTHVEFKVEVSDTRLDITAPFWRTDIHIAEDVVEEIGRLYGYDNLVLDLPYKTIKPASNDEILGFKTEIRNLLVRAGSNELLTYNFIGEKLMTNVGQDTKFAYELSSPLSPDLQFYRTSLLPSLLDKVHSNIKSGFQEFSIFEMNKVHVKNNNDPKEPELPAEMYRLANVIAIDDKLAKSEYSGAAYYQAKFYLDYLLYTLGINYEIQPINTEEESEDYKNSLAPFEKSRAAVVVVEGELVGFVGEPSLSVRVNLKLPDFISMYELDLSKILKFKTQLQYKKLSNYQFVEQDICFKVKADISYQELFVFLNTELNNLLNNSQYSLAPLDIFQKDAEKEFKQVTFRLRINSYEKTLKTSDVNQVISILGNLAGEKFNAVIV